MDQTEADRREITAVRALLGAKPRPVGWAERRARIAEVSFRMIHRKPLFYLHLFSAFRRSREAPAPFHRLLVTRHPLIFRQHSSHPR